MLLLREQLLGLLQTVTRLLKLTFELGDHTGRISVQRLGLTLQLLNVLVTFQDDCLQTLALLS